LVGWLTQSIKFKSKTLKVPGWNKTLPQ